MIETDVLVVGGGPAGSVASTLLQQRKRRVLCLEGGYFPRFQIGESLLPRCIDVLEEADLLKDVVGRGYLAKNAAMFWKGNRSERFCFAEVFPGQRTATFQVPRHDFDQTLATGARKHGVDLRFGHRVDEVEVSAEGCRAVAVDVESETKVEVKARFVLDCSGYGRVLPRLLKLEKPSVLQSRMAMFTHVEGDVRPEGALEGDIWACLHPRGAWIWIIPFSNGRTSVGLVAEPQLFASVPGCDRDKLMALVREEPNARERLRHAVPVMKAMKLESWSAAVTSLHGPGWALTGNAGEFLDPIFSSGVTLALESASRSVALIDRQLSGQPVDWEKDYAQVLDKGVGVFKTFVKSWYADELPRVLLADNKSENIKRAITAVLGGYVLDESNPFVRAPDRTLQAVLKLA